MDGAMSSKHAITFFDPLIAWRNASAPDKDARVIHKSKLDLSSTRFLRLREAVFPQQLGNYCDGEESDGGGY
jgi:hypothetical protein